MNLFFDRLFFWDFVVLEEMVDVFCYWIKFGVIVNIGISFGGNFKLFFIG